MPAVRHVSHSQSGASSLTILAGSGSLHHLQCGSVGIIHCLGHVDRRAATTTAFQRRHSVDRRAWCRLRCGGSGHSAIRWLERTTGGSGIAWSPLTVSLAPRFDGRHRGSQTIGHDLAVSLRCHESRHLVRIASAPLVGRVDELASLIRSFADQAVASPPAISS